MTRSRQRRIFSLVAIVLCFAGCRSEEVITPTLDNWNSHAATVSGLVTNGVRPLAGVILVADIGPEGCARFSPGGVTTGTDSAGRFRMEVLSHTGPSRQCVRVSPIFASEADRERMSVKTEVFFRTTSTRPYDSVEVVLRVP